MGRAGQARGEQLTWRCGGSNARAETLTFVGSETLSACVCASACMSHTNRSPLVSMERSCAVRPITSSPTIGATCPRSVQMTVSESGFQASSPWSCSRQKTCMSGSCRLCSVWFEGWWAAHEAGREEQLVLRGEGEARDAALVAAKRVGVGGCGGRMTAVGEICEARQVSKCSQ